MQSPQILGDQRHRMSHVQLWLRTLDFDDFLLLSLQSRDFLDRTFSKLLCSQVTLCALLTVWEEKTCTQGTYCSVLDAGESIYVGNTPGGFRGLSRACSSAWYGLGRS